MDKVGDVLSTCYTKDFLFLGGATDPASVTVAARLEDPSARGEGPRSVRITAVLMGKHGF